MTRKGDCNCAGGCIAADRASGHTSIPLQLQQKYLNSCGWIAADRLAAAPAGWLRRGLSRLAVRGGPGERHVRPRLIWLLAWTAPQGPGEHRQPDRLGAGYTGECPANWCYTDAPVQ